MDALSVAVTHELEGWTLLFAELSCEDPAADGLGELRRRVAAEVRSGLTREELSGHPPVSAMRRLFRAAGCDPTRYRPSSEALLRRLLKGDDLPAVHPLVDLANCLSAAAAVPCCVMAEGSFSPPFVLRTGCEGEAYESLRGPFQLAGRPLLTDADGPLDTPITGNTRVKVVASTVRAWLVAYLPAAAVDPDAVERLLRLQAGAAPGVALGRLAIG